MPPRKRTKKNEEEQDKLFEKSEKKMEKSSKWLQVLESAEAQEPPLEKPTKTTPSFDFSKEQQFLKAEEERLRKKEELERLIDEADEEMPDEAELSDKQTDEEKAERMRKVERIKERKKMKKQRQRQLRRLQIEEFQKQKDLMRQQQIKNQEALKKQPQKPNYLPYIIFALFFGLLYMTYKGQVYQRLERFQVTADLYEVLQADSSLSNTQLKGKYKKLVLKYHPDKNRNCVGCKEKFTKIVEAWEVLGHPEKRQAYDNSHSIMKIKSNAVSLNEQNYHRLVEESDDLWIIEVYDETSEYCHRYSPIWEEIVNQFKGFVKFGRIDSWYQPQMLSYIPYKFKVFPSIYSLYKGQSDLYPFDMSNPVGSLKKWIIQQLKPQVIQIMETNFSIAELNKGNKVALVIPTERIYLPYPLRSIALRYHDYFQLFTVNPRTNPSFIEKHNIRTPKLFMNSSHSETVQIQTDNQGYLQLDRRISKAVVRHMSLDKMMDECTQQTCLLVLNMPALPHISNKHYPRIRVNDNKFYTKLQQMKKQTNQLQNFDLGLYMDGKIALGYAEDAQQLTLDEGELLELEYSKTVIVHWWRIAVGFVLVMWGIRRIKKMSLITILSIVIGFYYLIELNAVYEKLRVHM